MNEEIELKFIVAETAAKSVIKQLTEYAPILSDKQLNSFYFDSADQQLRQFDIGLRIRQIDDHYEMTLKTAGQIIAGLHQRPEYNVKLAEPVLDIMKFPAHVWPAKLNIYQLAPMLMPLFRTKFKRQIWRIADQNSQVEVVFDRGYIQAEDKKIPIHEIELERIAGDVTDLIQWAKKICGLDGIRLSHQSKAARGYALAQKVTKVPSTRQKSTLASPEQITNLQASELMLTALLNDWQQIEEQGVAGAQEAYPALLTLLQQLRQYWSLWGKSLPRLVTAELRIQLAKIETLLTTHQNVAFVVNQSVYTQFKLNVLHWLVSQAWYKILPTSTQQTWHESFNDFSARKYQRIMTLLRSAFAKNLTIPQYQDKCLLLQRQLLTLQLLLSVNENKKAKKSLVEWQLLLQAITQQQWVLCESIRKQAIKA